MSSMSRSPMSSSALDRRAIDGIRERPDDAPDRVPVLDAVRALAFVGDLSMGQPVDHSARTAWLAARLAEASCAARGEPPGDAPAHAICVALLRWSGCTANATEAAEVMGDDVLGRDAMLSIASATEAAAFASGLGELARIHCEVSGEISHMLGLPAEVTRALRHVFEAWDGSGRPAGLRGEAVPAAVLEAALAGDLEIFSRVHGLPAALRHIGERADGKYPRALVDIAIRQAPGWLAALDDGAHERDDAAVSHALAALHAPLTLVADVIDLKLPWMTGLSRRVAATARDAGHGLGLPDDLCGQLHRAGLLHGIGRASVPNGLWDAARRLGEADRERLRLMSYWTGRAGRRLPALTMEAELASWVDERLDGSGAFRGATGAGTPMLARVLAAAAQWETLRTARPDRAALTLEETRAAMRDAAATGRFDAAVVDALCGAGVRTSASASTSTSHVTLSTRETEVLARIALGESNKEAARELGISPSTVRTHLESAFRKLGCTTRAAATLKAMTMGLLVV